MDRGSAAMTLDYALSITLTRISMRTPLSTTARANLGALRIALTYALFAALWIVSSDTVVLWLFADAQQVAFVSTIKGWLFVAVTSLLLYWLIQRLVGDVAAAGAREVAAVAEKSRTQQLLAAIVNNSSDAIFAKDSAGRYLLFNPETARVLGKPVEAVMGADDTVTFPTPEAATVRKNDQQVMTENRTITFVEHLTTVDGERIFLATKGPLHDEAGVVIGMFGIARDVTDSHRAVEEIANHRQQLEQLVAQRTRELEAAKDAAETANRAKDAFLANISHEIRTPMNAVLGFTQLLLREKPEPTQANKLLKIDAAARHLLNIINDVLDISKIEAGKMRLASEIFTLASLFDDARAMFAEQAQRKGLTLIAAAPPLPGQLRGDITRLRQALFNYLGNAIKFSEHGMVTLRACIEQQDAGTVLLRFEVEDQGKGIASGEIDRLFEAFEQLDNTAAGSHGGTGLGLAITRRLARLMGGDAGASSTLGQGSCFWLTARLDTIAASASAPPDGSPGNSAFAELQRYHRGARILLAEDNAFNVEIARTLLQEAGLEVEVASDGRIALELVSTRPYDLVLMDVRMPHMDGLEATRAIRALALPRPLPILAMTANAFDSDRSVCLAAGMNDFVAKPFDPDVLFATMRKWLTPKLP